MGASLIDSFGRKIDNLRISVTDRCNFRCSYCMPEGGMAWMDHREILTYEEFTRLAGILVSLGISRIRLTGGEPLMRRDLHHLVSALAKLGGLKDLALTTNGYFLGEQAGSLAAAGLKRLNVSLDSLDTVKFGKLARRDHLEKVISGLARAREAGFSPIKLNVVIVRGVNDGDIPQFITLARTEPFIVRFIEFMPIGKEDGWNNEKVMTTAEIISWIGTLGHPLEPFRHNGRGPADHYRFVDGSGEIGFISPVSDPFCDHCNRIRITSDGRLRTCLFSVSETDLRTPLRAGASDDEIAGLITAAVAAKEAGHRINRDGFTRPERTMSSIGG